MTKVNKSPTKPSKPGKPASRREEAPTRRGELRREALLDAARDVFLEHGYSAASVEDVVTRVGGSKASLYQYFGNKEGLFGEMIAGQCKQFLSAVAFPNKLEGDIETTLTELGRRAMKMFLDPKRLAMHRAMIGEAARFPELAERFYESGPKRGIAALSEFFKAQHQSGTLNCPDPELAAIHFMDLVRSYPSWRALLGLSPLPRGRDMDEFIRTAVQTFLHGYARKS